MRRVIDLTLELEPSLNDYLEHPEKYLPPHMMDFPPILQKTELYPIWIPNWEGTRVYDGRRVHKLHSNLHAFTHSETPSHLVKNGKFLHDYPVDHWIAKACVMNFSEKAPNSKITPEELQKQWVQGCDAIIMRTDWAKRRGTKGVMGAKKEDFEAAPKLMPEAVQWVIGKKPKLYTDDFDVVPVPPSKRVFFEAGICHVMNITNVDQIKKKVVTLIALPLKLRRTNAGEGVEASPTRAVAIEED
jgi:kynurenine formamidase